MTFLQFNGLDPLNVTARTSHSTVAAFPDSRAGTSRRGQQSPGATTVACAHWFSQSAMVVGS